MNKREFIGHLFCDSRFKQLVKMIETLPLNEVIELRQLNEQCKKSVKYLELDKAFIKRLGM